MKNSGKLINSYFYSNKIIDTLWKGNEDTMKLIQCFFNWSAIFRVESSIFNGTLNGYLDIMSLSPLMRWINWKCLVSDYRIELDYQISLDVPDQFTSISRYFIICFHSLTKVYFLGLNGASHPFHINNFSFEHWKLPFLSFLKIVALKKSVFRRFSRAKMLVIF